MWTIFIRIEMHIKHVYFFFTIKIIGPKLKYHDNKRDVIHWALFIIIGIRYYIWTLYNTLIINPGKAESQDYWSRVHRTHKVVTWWLFEWTSPWYLDKHGKDCNCYYCIKPSDYELDEAFVFIKKIRFSYKVYEK